MKPDKKKYLYICDNCDFEFYLKNVVSNRLVECARCGNKTAYCVDDYMEDAINIEDNGDSDFMDGDFLTDSEYDDYFDYSE